ncbi:hypothetical protein Tco_1307345, partial [Tanacetum coccineum]
MTSSAPLTPEEIKVDKIVHLWLLFTISDSLRARLVVARPKTAKKAWGPISNIVKDNKRSCTNGLNQKIDSIVTILTSLDTRVNDEDVVHYVLEGLPDTYNQ